MRERTIGIVLVGVVVASLLGTPAGAATRVQSKGPCTLDPGHWVLTVQKATVAGKLTVRFVVQGTVPMQSWQVAISDNNVGLPGANLGSGKKGSFTFTRTILNRASRDHIVVYASDGPASCTGNVTY